MNSVMKIFAKGASKGSPGEGGWGIYIESDFPDKNNTAHGFVSRATENQMELCSIIFAIIAGYIKIPNKSMQLEILSNSMYVINGLTRNIHSWRDKNFFDVANPVLWKLLDDLIQDEKTPEVIFTWIKSHSGSYGNTAVDKLASVAIRRHSSTPFLGIDANDLMEEKINITVLQKIISNKREESHKIKEVPIKKEEDLDEKINRLLQRAIDEKNLDNKINIIRNIVENMNIGS